MIIRPANGSLQSHGAARRPGVAPMEFVMALPFLLILMSFIFTMTASSLTRAKAILQARNDAFHQRYQGGAGGSLSLPHAGDAPALGALANRPGTHGVVRGSGSSQWGSATAEVDHGLFKSILIRSTAQHEIFSGPWDHDTIKFQPHPPIVPDRRFAVYFLSPSGAADGLNAFHQLLDHVQSGQEAGHIQNALNSISNKANQLNQQITAMENRLNGLRDSLRVATDSAVIRDLQRQINELSGHIDRLKSARDLLRNFMNRLQNG